MTHPLVDPVVRWYDGAARDLPWRRPDRTPWGVLVSEIMLQQTPVARVEPVWLRWMTRWPTAADLAGAPTADVLREWGRLGYPRRALRLQECARVLVEEHGGELPTDEATLRTLPGIGTYTAAAVVAFAHGRRAVVLDTNVRRVLGRSLDGVALPPPSLTVGETRRAGSVVPDDDALAATFAVAVMELGALVCTARAPRCDACPVATACAWRAAGRPADAHAARRRRQGWAGTDRQVRGRVMARLRDAVGPVAVELLTDVTDDAGQRSRVLAGLVADGLAVAVVGPDGATTGYELPT